MKKFVTLDNFAAEHKIAISDAFDKVLSGELSAVVQLGSMDNPSISIPAYYRLSKSTILELKNLSLSDDLRNYALQIFHPKLVVVDNYGNSHLMAFDVITDYYLDKNNYKTEIPSNIQQEEQNKSDEIQVAFDVDETSDESQKDKNTHVCPVVISHTSVTENGKQYSMLDEASISYIQEMLSLYPRFCRVTQVEDEIDLDYVKKKYSLLVVAFFLRHYSTDRRKYLAKDTICTVTKKKLNGSSIFLTNQSWSSHNLRLPAYLDPSKPEFEGNERGIALISVIEGLATGLHPNLSHRAKVTRILKDLGFDYEETDPVVEHFSYATTAPGTSRTHPMKKKKK